MVFCCSRPKTGSPLDGYIESGGSMTTTIAKLLTATAIIGSVSACGGGGGVASTPTPSGPPTPAPAQTIASPSTGQFATEAAHADASYDLAANEVLSSDSSPTTMQVHYNASTRTYSLTSGTRSFSFGSAALQTGSAAGESRYRHRSNGTTEYLTLVTKPYNLDNHNKYVGLGYWETIQASGGEQSSQFDIFAYGYKTPANAVPKAGGVSYDMDAFAMVAVPGQEPKALAGAGSFDIDFLTGAFSAEAFVEEYALGSDTIGSGGSIVLRAGGHVGSGNSFSGNVTYTGFVSSTIGPSVSGTIQGSFFGPNAEEIGASFIADNVDGAHVAGAITGQQTNRPPATLAISNLPIDTTFNSRSSELRLYFDTTTTTAFKDASGYANDRWWEPGKVTLKLNGDVIVQTTYNNDPRATFTSADRSLVQKENFTSFDASDATLFASSDKASVHFDLYKIGKDNPELQLSYVGFGIWSQTFLGTDTYNNRTSRTEFFQYILYGLETQKSLMSGKTGSASYRGVVYGNSATTDGVLQDVGGTSRFDVDFSTQTFAGSLDLTVGDSGGPKSALGTWTFSNQLVNGQMGPTPLFPNNATFQIDDTNTINPRFYGPDGSEIGATFSIIRSMSPPNIMGGSSKISITGVTVANRQ